MLDELLDKLAQQGLQDDERFAMDFVHYRVNKGQGPLKIEQELSLRGIDSELSHELLYSGTIDWLTLACDVRNKKFGQALPNDYQNKAKQSRFLYSRGFTGDLISQVLK